MRTSGRATEKGLFGTPRRYKGTKSLFPLSRFIGQVNYFQIGVICLERRTTLDGREKPASRKGILTLLSELAITRQLRLLPNFGHQIYSVRNACIGSMREARRAGPYAATNATAVRRKITPEKTVGSVGVVPNSRDSIHLLNTKEPSVPSATPARVSRRVLVRTSRCTSQELAPIAIRIPISLVR